MRVILIKIGSGTKIQGSKAMLPALGLHTIKEALVRRGIADVHVFHEGQHNRNLIKKTASETNEQVALLLSTTSDELSMCNRLASNLKESLPESMIFAGGPAFELEENGEVSSQLKKALREINWYGETVFDLVNAGDAESVVTLLSEHAGKFREVELPGIYYMGPEGETIGFGRGAYPIKDFIPYIWDETAGAGTIYMDPRCPHNCGFCSLNAHSLGFSKELMLQTLREISEMAQAVYYPHFAFFDSNPIALPSPNLLDHSEMISPKGKPNLLKKIYLDPTLLTTPDSLRLITRLVLQGFIGFYIGRDTPSEQTAAAIRSNNKGIPKKQKQLDEEKKAIALLIKTLGELKKRFSYPPRPFEIGLSYIFTPFDTRATIHKIFDEFKKFRELATKDVLITLNSNVLSPYPGSWVRNTHFASLSNQGTIATTRNVWKDSFGPISTILDEVAAGSFVSNMEYRAYMFGIEQAYARIHQNIDRIFDGDQNRRLVNF